MNKRQRKKASKKWFEVAVYIEDPMYEPINVGLGAWGESPLMVWIRWEIAKFFAVPGYIWGHCIGGHAPAQLLLGWDGAK